jgi:hypothetical protein
LTKLSGACAFLLLLGFVGISYAAEVDKNQPTERPLLPRVDLNGYLRGYSVQLNTDQPNQSYLPQSQGLTTLQDQDEIRGFLGLKLTKPLETK